MWRAARAARRPLVVGVASVAGAALVRGGVECYASADRSSAASSLPTADALDELQFKAKFRGQLSPELPPASASETAVVRDASGISWQRGAYGSWWLRLGGSVARGLPTVPQLNAALDEAIERGKVSKVAVYVGVHELDAEPGVTALLRARGFKYHHFAPNEPQPKTDAGGSGYGVGEHIYYRWLGNPAHDMVPSYATSIEGVGALVLSPDEKKVLLIWEYGNWKPVSGAVDEGESILFTLAREASEEVDVKLDHSFAPVSVGGWQCARARDARINDNFHAFVVRAVNEELTLDDCEVSSARWFDTATLLDVYKAAGRPSPFDKRTVPAPPALADALQLPDTQRKLGTNALQWLHLYTQGRGLPCTTQEAAPGRPEAVFIGSGPSTASRQTRAPGAVV